MRQLCNEEMIRLAKNVPKEYKVRLPGVKIVDCPVLPQWISDLRKDVLECSSLIEALIFRPSMFKPLSLQDVYDIERQLEENRAKVIMYFLGGID